MTKLIPVVILLALSLPICMAQGGPPVITDDPGTPGNNHWEINTAFVTTVLPHEAEFQSPFFDFNYGAGDHVQLKFQIPVDLLNGNTGVGNPQIGAKIRFVDESKYGVSISTYPQFTFPGRAISVQQNLASPGWQMFLPIEISKTVGKFQLDGEAGYNIQQQAPNEIWLGTVEAYELTDRIELLAELHEIEAQHFAESVPVFDLGTRIKFSNRMSLLFAAGRSLPRKSSQEQKFFSFLGIQFRL